MSDTDAAPSKRPKRTPVAKEAATPPAPKKEQKKEDDTDILLEAYCMPFPAEAAALMALARRMRPEAPLQAFEAAGVRLVGPFEVLVHDTDVDWASKDLHLWHRWVNKHGAVSSFLQGSAKGIVKTRGWRTGR